MAKRKFLEEMYAELADLELTEGSADEIFRLCCDFGLELEGMAPCEVDQLAYKLQRLGRLLQLSVEASLRVDLRPEFSGSGKKPKRLFLATLLNHHYEGRGPQILFPSVSAESAKKRARLF